MGQIIVSLFYRESYFHRERPQDLSHSFLPFHVQTSYLKVKKAANEENKFEQISPIPEVIPADILEKVQKLEQKPVEDQMR